MAQFTRHELGVHLGQPARDYLADVGLGYSAIKENVISPVEWWHKSPFNPTRKAPTWTKAFFRGEATHTFFLDGKRMYERMFAVYPTASSHPHYLDTVAQLQMACAQHGLSTLGNKPDLIKRLIKAKAPVKILEHERGLILRKAKREIAEEDDTRIRILYAQAMRDPKELMLPDGEHLTLKDAFANALNEVSVYWIDEFGIRQRARFDFLKPNFTGDLKSITDWNAGDFRTALLREVVFRGYLIQQAHYREARHQLRIAVDEGRVFGGNKTQRKRLGEIASAEDWAWLFVFAKLDGAPQVRGIVTNHDNPRYSRAVEQRMKALTLHTAYHEFFGGYETPWFDPDVIWTPTDEDWPMMGEFGRI